MKRKAVVIAGISIALVAGLFYLFGEKTDRTISFSNSAVRPGGTSAPSQLGTTSVSTKATPPPSVSASAVVAGMPNQALPSFKAMDERGTARAEAMAIKLSGVNTEFGDLYSLARTEAPDPKWSADTESAINVALRSGGAGYAGLQVGPPQCSATVCIVEAAVNPGANSQGKSSDWQTLIGSVYAEPWFANNFMDARVVMADDPTGTVYISVFERKQ